MLMSANVTQILQAIEQGDPRAADALLPLVYDELRKLAAQKMAHEKPGQTLDATALVHEAYIRLVTGPVSTSPGPGDVASAPQASDATPASGKQRWNSRGHFFAAAAEAMRRILMDNARRKRRLKHGGGLARADVDECEIAVPEVPDDLLALDEALEQLAATDAPAANLVKLRYFAGLTVRQAAEVLGVSPRTADFLWAYARAWLLEKIEGAGPPAARKPADSGEKS
jgi:RNA polymerase sigma factor (sigma-70 family)